MFLTTRKLWNNGRSLLATVGDGAASFLENPGEKTQNRCVADSSRHVLEGSCLLENNWPTT